MTSEARLATRPGHEYSIESRPAGFQVPETDQTFDSQPPDLDTRPGSCLCLERMTRIAGYATNQAWIPDCRQSSHGLSYRPHALAEVLVDAAKSWTTAKPDKSHFLKICFRLHTTTGAGRRIVGLNIPGSATHHSQWSHAACAPLHCAKRSNRNSVELVKCVTGSYCTTLTSDTHGCAGSLQWPGIHPAPFARYTLCASHTLLIPPTLLTSFPQLLLPSIAE
jgi:hypothetical protein